MIFQITAITHRDRRTFRITNTKDKYINTFFLGSGSSLRCTWFMVFTISNHNDSTSNIVLLGKTFRSQINGISYIGALCLNQTRGNILQEHLGRNVIAGNRQLYKRIASKNNQSNLVIGKIINQIFYQHLTLVKTGRNDILCQHRVGDIQTNDSFNTLALIMRNLATQLRTSQHDNQKCQC